MRDLRKSASIFSQTTDRIAFTAYFLGAVVPLLLLTFVADRYVLPTLSDRFASVGLIGLVASSAALTLGSFLVLRRSTRQTLKRMDDDNRQLASLLDASGALATASHGAEAATTAARFAAQLADASAAYVFMCSDRSGPPVLLEAAGDGAEKLQQKIAAPLADLVNLVIREGRPVLRGSKAERGWAGVSAVVVPLSGEKSPVGALAVVQTDPRRALDARNVDGISTLASLASVSLRNSDLQDAQRNFFAHMTEIVVSAMDQHVDYLSGHGQRVAQYANRVGRELRLDDSQLQRLHFAALLHDIGMLKIDRSLLGSAKACEKHPQLGYRMLGRIRLWEDVAPIVLHHHEWFDGNGYPEGVAGAAIPLESRIISVCDAFDAMVSETSYKVSRTADEAVQELVDCSGTQFDPEVVEVFARLAGQGIIEPKTT